MCNNDKKTRGVYALFADVHKEYDQVWREGLYFILYAQGLRGPLWRMVRAWLDGAQAETEWNGVRGPVVCLEQGLRQGCVLSPILYCSFINALLMQEGGQEMPDALKGVAKEVFGWREEGSMVQPQEGVWCQALGRKVAVMLYMDDTTLLAKTKEELMSLTALYVKFCHKFRLRLNASKSATMSFHKSRRETVTVIVGERTFKSPESGVHKHLGFRLDAGLSGKAQLEHAMQVAKAKLHTLNVIAKRMGEPMALWYLRTVVGPAALYGLELAACVTPTVAKQLRGVFTRAVGEAVLCGAVNQWWTSQVWVRREAMLWESTVLPWDLGVKKQVIGLLRSLATANGSLAAHLFEWDSENKFVGRAIQVAREVLGPTWKTVLGASKHAFKGAMEDCFRHLLHKERVAGLALREPTMWGKQSNAVYVQSMQLVRERTAHPKVAHVWAELIPNVFHRVFLRRMQMGCIPNLKVNTSKC